MQTNPLKPHCQCQPRPQRPHRCMTSAMAMQRLDVSAMHEKVMVIFNSIDVDIKPKDTMLLVSLVSLSCS
jgi:hypothetical protein